MTTSGPKRLKEWMDAEGLGATELARRLGVARASVYNWLAGSNTPDLETAVKIEAMTRLMVRSSDWVDLGKLDQPA